MKCFQLKIKGKVQGVWFRGSTKQIAEELGLKGFVRNEPDGSVYVEGEGDELKLTAFIEWCKKGPQLARVIDVEWEEVPLKNYKIFEVIRH